MRTILVAALVALPVVPFAAAHHDPALCTPITVGPTVSVPTPDGRGAHLWAHASGRDAYASLWQETNGLPGLQVDAQEFNCGHPPDRLVARACTVVPSAIPGEFLCLVYVGF